MMSKIYYYNSPEFRALVENVIQTSYLIKHLNIEHCGDRTVPCCLSWHRQYCESPCSLLHYLCPVGGCVDRSECCGESSGPGDCCGGSDHLHHQVVNEPPGPGDCCGGSHHLHHQVVNLLITW
jgi:hypothetical protein